MDIREIYTETPEDEQWRLLLQFTYPTNIKRYLDDVHAEDNLIESISGSILQAKEYFDASRSSSLLISPLLLYYGTANLFYGLTNLIHKEIVPISGHGMKANIVKGKTRIADITVTPNNPEQGALASFAKTFSSNIKVTDTGEWNWIELISSIPDLLDVFLTCYPSEDNHTVPVDVIKERDNSYEKVKIDYLNRFERPDIAFSGITQFKNNYLTPQYTQSTEHIVLRPKLFNSDIGVYSLSGRKHLAISHTKKGRNIDFPIEIYSYMALFCLGFISRYRAEFWNPFVRNDSSGEKLVVEKFLYYARRSLPNLVLNKLYNINVKFINVNQGFNDISSILSEDHVKEIVRNEITKYIDQKRGGL